METFNVGKIEEFEDKSKKVVTIGDEEVGVFRLGDEFFAWRNICPTSRGANMSRTYFFFSTRKYRRQDGEPRPDI